MYEKMIFYSYVLFYKTLWCLVIQVCYSILYPCSSLLWWIARIVVSRDVTFHFFPLDLGDTNSKIWHVRFRHSDLESLPTRCSKLEQGMALLCARPFPLQNRLCHSDKVFFDWFGRYDVCLEFPTDKRNFHKVDGVPVLLRDYCLNMENIDSWAMTGIFPCNLTRSRLFLQMQFMWKINSSLQLAISWLLKLFYFAYFLDMSHESWHLNGQI